MEAASAGVDRLVVRAACGDVHALGNLYAATHERLLAVSLRIVGRDALAREAVHDAFLKIWMHAARYRPEEGPALAWMSTIVRNHSHDVARRAREVPDVDGRLSDQLADPAASPESLAMSSHDSRVLCGCIAALDPVHRQALMLAYARDMSHAEVAAHLGRPLGTVKTHIRRAIFLLRECMDAAQSPCGGRTAA
jgi:RNA polymerase sigma-70 factor (ECF subfamily)